MADLDPHHGRSSEEAPRLLAMEPWIRGARVLWVGAAAEESVEWLHRLGATRVSVVGSRIPTSLRADVYLEPDGLSAVPSGRHDLMIIQDFGARLAAEPDLVVDFDRLLSSDGRVVGILPADGEHVGVDMLAHCHPTERLDYAEVVSALEQRFDYVTAIAQVPLLGYLVTGTGEDRAIEFDGRIADLASEPPIYHLVAGFRSPPDELPNRISTLSFDLLSDRVGQVVASLSEQRAATRRDANLSLNRVEQRLEALQTELIEATREREADQRRVKRLLRDRDGLKAEVKTLKALETKLRSELAQGDDQLGSAANVHAHLQSEIERWQQRTEGLLAASLELEDQHQALAERHDEQDQALTAQRQDTTSARAEAQTHQAEAARWKERADEFLKLSLRLQEEQENLEQLLIQERAQRAADPRARDLVALRVEHQEMAAQAHALTRRVTQHRREHAETLGQLRRVQAQHRQSEGLLKEAQDRLESAAQNSKGAHETELLKHLKAQLSEALGAQETLDDRCVALQAELKKSHAEAKSFAAKVADLELLRPRLAEFEEDAKLLKERFNEARDQAAKSQADADEKSEAFGEAQAREALLKERSIELAEAVSNLAARVDLLERETQDQVQVIAQTHERYEKLKSDLSEEKKVTGSLRQQLEASEKALTEVPQDVEVDTLQAQLDKLEQRYQATLEALNQQGAEVAAREQAQRNLELENQRLRASQLARKLEPSDRVVELQQRISQVDQDRERLEGELSSLRIRHEKQSAQLDGSKGLKEEVQALRADRTSLSTEIDRLTPFEALSAELEANQSEQAAVITELEKQVREQQGRADEYSERLDESEAQVQRAQRDSSDQVQAARRELEERLAEAEERASNAQRKVETLETQLEAERSEHQRHLQANQQMTSERDRLQSRIEQLMQDHKNLLQEGAQLDAEASMSLADHAQTVAQARAIESELRSALTGAQEALAEAHVERQNAEEEVRDQQAKLSEHADRSERLQNSVDQLEEQLSQARTSWVQERDELDQQHELTLQKRLAQAADVQQGHITKLESELTELKDRAASIQAQEDRILQLVEEQRQAADQAWDLAIAQRTARFAALIDRFDQVVHATVHKEAES